MADKIIFLDIDGPMIPGTHYLVNKMASFEQDFCPRCVMVLRKILEKSNAKVVFNSTHNLHLYPDKKIGMPGLLTAFEQYDLTKYLHPSIKTVYPAQTRSDLVPRDCTPSPRLIAIYEWLHNHYDMSEPNRVLWIAFDDEKIDHKRAITVDFDAGLTMKEYDHAGKYLNFSTLMI